MVRASLCLSTSMFTNLTPVAIASSAACARHTLCQNDLMSTTLLAPRRAPRQTLIASFHSELAGSFLAYCKGTWAISGANRRHLPLPSVQKLTITTCRDHAHTTRNARTYLRQTWPRVSSHGLPTLAQRSQEKHCETTLRRPVERRRPQHEQEHTDEQGHSETAVQPRNSPGA